MFVAEGNLKVLEDPTQYIGKFGFMHNDGISTTRVTGPEWLVKRAASLTSSRLARQNLPDYVGPEEITSPEQARLFATQSDRGFTIARFKEFDLLEKISGQMKEGEELLGGAVRLWEETRVPTPYVYCYAAGRLLTELVYDRATGWEQASDIPYIERKEFGLKAPGFFIGATLTRRY